MDIIHVIQSQNFHHYAIMSASDIMHHIFYDFMTKMMSKMWMDISITEFMMSYNCAKMSHFWLKNSPIILYFGIGSMVTFSGQFYKTWPPVINFYY